MKTVLLLIVAVALALTGCRSLPDLQADHWVHDGHYAIATTHYEATNVTSLPDGRIHVGTYTGAVVVAGGYGVSDTIQGLTYTPGQKPASPAPTAPAAK